MSIKRVPPPVQQTDKFSDAVNVEEIIIWIQRPHQWSITTQEAKFTGRAQK